MNASKSKPNGFTVLEVILIIIVIATLGFAGWTWWQSRPADQMDSAGQETDVSSGDNQMSQQEIPQGWVEYSHEKLGYSFWHPPRWDAEVNTNQEDGTFYNVILRSDSFDSENNYVGGVDVIQGVKITFNMLSNFTDDKLTDQFDQGLQKRLYNNGTIDPRPIKVNGRDGIEYAYRHEGPNILHVDFYINENQIVSTNFQSKGKESEHPAYETYKTILGTIE